jgi:RNA polymerase subunit RPABC4/transcription elongation factor Spt4
VARLICPACNAPDLSFDNRGILVCPYCGTRIAGEAVVCPRCSHINPLEAEQCLNCGEALTMMARVVLRQGEAAREPFFLERARERAAGLKSQGDLASEARMERFREVDRSRKLREAQELARRQTRDRKLLLASAGALGMLVIAILIGLMITVIRLPGP